ncbi:uncharacterized protein TNCV_4483621 [Trichonephila clavipes]|nr:uncharacterized protein TNCV_4483621 [Trichonephila clavipes]
MITNGPKNGFPVVESILNKQYYYNGIPSRPHISYIIYPESFLALSKNVKSGKGPLTPAGLLKFVKRFEETGKLEDRARAGRPCLKEARAPCIAVEMEAIATEAASGTNSAREAARRLGLSPSSVRNILRRILQLYPHKLQSCHELLPADTAQR